MTSWKLEASGWNDFQQVKIKRAPKPPLGAPGPRSEAGSKWTFNRPLEVIERSLARSLACSLALAPPLTHLPQASVSPWRGGGGSSLSENPRSPAQSAASPIPAALHPPSGARPGPMPEVPTPNCQSLREPQGSAPPPPKARNQTSLPFCIARPQFPHWAPGGLSGEAAE